MIKTTTTKYQLRMQRVLDYIDQHLDEEMDLDTLAGVAAFSKYHFHRQFVARFGVTPHRYVQLVRMKRASYQLALREDASVTSIAMESLYDASDAFTRAFKGHIGQVPSAFRKTPDWDSWFAKFGPISEIRNQFMTDFSVNDVIIQEVPTTAVAIMRHRGDPRHIRDTIQRFISWRKATGLVPQVSATFTVYHDDPHMTAPADFRMDLCAATDRVIEANDQGVEAGFIPGGRCAMLRTVGMSENLEPAALFLYRDWLPTSGQEPRDFPLYCQRVTFYPDVPEHEAITDLYLPLK